MESQFLPIHEGPGPMIVAGPCSAESEEQVLTTAHALAQLGVDAFRAGLWKPRTRPGGFEGVGSRGLAWLRRVRSETGLRIATEVATARHVEQALASDVDIVWIGARTTADPFAVQEIADALRGAEVSVLVKNPTGPDLELWIGAIERLLRAGIRHLGAVHRGFVSFEGSAYRNPPQWAIPIELHRRMPQLPLLCDPSHIAGRRDGVQTVACQALELGFDGLLVECHCNPARALSDATQQLTPDEMARLLQRIPRIRTDNDARGLQALRSRIDALDEELLQVLAHRMEVSRAIGRHKHEHGLPILQPHRYDELLRGRTQQGAALGLDAAFVGHILRTIHEESVRQQLDLTAPELGKE